MLRRNKNVRLLAATLLAASSTAFAGFQPPIDSVSDRTLSSLHDDLAARHWSDAIDRIETAYADPTLLAKKDDRLVCLRAWVNEALTDPAAAKAFAEAYERKSGPAAAAALATAVHNGDVTAIARVAARYSWTAAAAHAPLDMATALAAVGDVRNVQSLLHSIANAPLELKSAANLPSDGGGRPLQFAAPWYSLIRPIDFPRDVPWISKDTVYLASTTAVAAITLQGRLLWTAGHVAAPIDTATLWPHAPASIVMALFGERSLSQPALWCDAAGAAKIVIARQSEGSISSLVAYRAADGSMLWRSGTDAATSSLLYTGTPLIIGRYVYALALDYQPPALPKTCIVALDLPNGRLLWRSDVGDATLPVLGVPGKRTKGTGSIVQALLSGSSAELTADDKSIYASLEGGSILSIDRFCGQTNWIAAYSARTIGYRDLTRMRETKSKAVDHRWHDRVVRYGDLAVIAPTDSTGVIAYSAATGKQLWTFDSGDGADLVGTAGENFILAGRQITALKADGTNAWQIDYTNAPIGPPIIDGQLILTPTQSGLTIYDAATGKATLPPLASVVTFDSIMKPQAATRKALDTLGLLGAFAPPPSDTPAAPVNLAKNQAWKTQSTPKKASQNNER